MGNLKDFLADTSASGGVIRKPAPGKKQPKSNYVAVGHVLKNTLPNFGEQYTPAGGTAVTLSGSNVAPTIKALCYAGLAFFFGNGTVNGKKGKPSEFKESVVYGTRTVARPTGEVEEKVDIDFKHQFSNIEFFNNLRAQGFEFDTYLFTDKSVQVIRFDTNEPTFHDIGHTIDGDIKKDISGSYSITWGADGELVAELGVTEAQLADSDIVLAFGPATLGTGLTAVASVPNQYTMKTGAASSLTRVVNTTGAAGVKYYLFKNLNEAVPNTVPVTIDTLTGVITIGASIAVGRYQFTVAAENQTGVQGTFPITLDVTAA